MAKQITSVTEAGYKKLKDELDYLKNVKRKEAAARVGDARSYGDLSENSEYDDAKNEQAKVEAQIAELEETIAHVKIVNHEDINTNVANIGLTVTVLYIDDEATVKRYFKENGHFRLQPENDSMQPIIVSDVTILGKVISLLRKM